DVSLIDDAFQELLFDPQTSGGLLISVNAKQAQDMLQELKEYNPDAAIIGQITTKKEKSIIVY
ncbi:MAG: AIR synthase-related protein, partial [Bacilli bacterium]